jgi:hypothetical protein
MSAYVPDVGETFTVTRVIRYRRWQWWPFPWYRQRELTDTHKYRVTGWLRRRSLRPEPTDEQSRLVREILDELIADGSLDGPRGVGPDNVPLEFCRREDAEYVSGYGVAGTIARVADVVVDGVVSRSAEYLEDERRHAERLAGEPLWRTLQALVF